MTLVLRKLLASSTFAIAGALTTLSNRLKAKVQKQETAESLEEELDKDMRPWTNPPRNGPTTSRLEPQRIEQPIGRCHRYGQKHDVVVVNFLNRKSAADQRVFELLSEKFHLFEGVFGASDEVLGAIESGIDFERRIAAIYKRCRKPNEIQGAFDQLQLELSP